MTTAAGKWCTVRGVQLTRRGVWAAPKYDDEVCVVCLDNMVHGGLVCRVRCGHEIHFACFRNMAMHDVGRGMLKCPVCKEEHVITDTPLHPVYTMSESAVSRALRAPHASRALLPSLPLPSLPPHSRVVWADWSAAAPLLSEDREGEIQTMVTYLDSMLQGGLPATALAEMGPQ